MKDPPPSVEIFITVGYTGDGQNHRRVVKKMTVKTVSTVKNDRNFQKRIHSSIGYIRVDEFDKEGK